MHKLVSKVSDFTTLPGPRYRKDGDYSADQFFEDCVLPSLRQVLDGKADRLLIDFDDTLGYVSSFAPQLALRIKHELKDKSLIKRKIMTKSEDDAVQGTRFWHEIEQN